jgi:hypothetical protein
MTIRRFPLSQSLDSETLAARSIPWLSMGVLLSGVTACGAVFALVTAQGGQGTGWSGTLPSIALTEAFGTGPNAEAMRRPAKLLSGVGAQTFSRGAQPNALAETDLPQIAPNIAPVAWDRLSAGDCITVTAKSGQTFSFHILGARPVGKPDQADNLAKIELAVSGCADMGEPVAKAVIQPTNPPVDKHDNAARSL